MSEIVVRTHPGKIIKDALDATNMSNKEFAIRSGISERTLSDIINEKGNITFDVAEKLASYFSNSVEVWMNLQTQYNVYMMQQQYKQDIEEDYKCIKTIVPYLKNLGIINDNDSINGIVSKTRCTIGINKLKYLDAPNTFVSLKELKSNKKDHTLEQNLWISLSLTKARALEVKEYDGNKVKSYLNELRSLTTWPFELFMIRLKEIMADCGISFVLLPYLAKSNVFGATKWLSSSKVMLALSNRGGRADLFWFTFFHELAHVTFMHKRYMILTSDGIIDKEADEFASNILISPKDWNNFIKANDFTIESIKSFANSINILPCIVLGRLEKEKYIPYGKYDNELGVQYKL